MPNWVDNALVFDKKEDYEKVKDYAGGQKDDKWDYKNLDFNTFISCAIELEDQDDWYNWNVKNWGCKWNASETSWNDDTCTIFFSTPWSGISNILLARISSVCKEKITYHYGEPSMDFGGTITAKQGKLIGETNDKTVAFDYFGYDEEENEEK